MKRSRFGEEQIIGILKKHQAGLGAKELCRKHGISHAAFDLLPSENTEKSCPPGRCHWFAIGMMAEGPGPGLDVLLLDRVRAAKDGRPPRAQACQGSCSRSLTFHSESGERMYIITASQLISGLVLKSRTGLRLVIDRGHRSHATGSSEVLLTIPRRWQIFASSRSTRKAAVRPCGRLRKTPTLLSTGTTGSIWADRHSVGTGNPYESGALGHEFQTTKVFRPCRGCWKHRAGIGSSGNCSPRNQPGYLVVRD